MTINVITELVQLDGTPVPDTDGKPMTLRSVFCNVLTTQRQGENIAGLEKVKRYDLALGIYREEEVSLSVDNIKLLMDLVAESYIPLIVGQVWHMLDPKAVPESA